MKTTISHAGGMKFVATNLHHTTLIDFPKELGGNAEGANPFQLLLSAFGASLGRTIIEYCKTAGISSECLRLDLDWKMSSNPVRLESVRVGIQLPSETWMQQGEAIKDLVYQCPIFKSLQSPPKIEVALGQGQDTP